MPPGQIPIPRPLQPLHVYRHLLREASYLPPVCQPFVCRRISESFRKEQEKHPKPKFVWGPQDTTTGRTERRRVTNALLRGDARLKILRAANSGDMDRMRRIILMSFGRLGKRRMELLSALVRPDGPVDSDALEKQLQSKEQSRNDLPQTSKRPTATTLPGYNSDPTRDSSLNPIVQVQTEAGGGDTKLSNEDHDPTLQDHNASALNQPSALSRRLKKSPVLENWDTKGLRKYINSQAEQQAKTSAGIWPRFNATYRMTIPKENIWGRPTPQKRVRTMQQKWWKATADKIMPPLGKAEWDLLKSLASGEATAAEWKAPPRRPIALTLPLGGTTGQAAWDWKTYSSRPVRSIERKRSRHFILHAGEIDNSPYSQSTGPKKHGATKRELRREFARVWEITSYIKQDPQTLTKSFTWGHITTSVPPASSADVHIFQNVDSKGKPREG